MKMSKWLIIAGSMMALGLVIFAVVMSALHWDFSKLGTSKFVTNSYEISDTFRNISVDTDTADVVFLPSGDGICKVVCYEEENVLHDVFVEDGTLKIRVQDYRKWFMHIGIHFTSPKITIYLPQSEYGALAINGSTGDVSIGNHASFESVDISMSTGDVKCQAPVSGMLKIKTSTGDISAQKLSAAMVDLIVTTGKVTVSGVTCQETMRIKVSTGKANVTDTQCKNLISTGSTGNITLKNVIAAEKFFIERSTGDVKFDRADAAEIYVKVSTGDVRGSLRSEKVFLVDASTGDVSVPQTTTGGRCEIITDTGDVRITLAG